MRSIVLVDDSADIRMLVRSRLEVSGAFTVTGEGASGLDAVSLATQHQPDIVLLDVSMAGMDGLEAIPLIITASPRTHVIMFSGFDEHGLAERAIAMGATDFIQKSTPMSELAGRLLKALGETTHELLPTIDDEAIPAIEDHLERFRAAFEDAAIGMATLTLTGRIVRANAALDRLVAGRPGGLVGALFADLCDAESLPGVQDLVHRVATGLIDADNTNHRVTASPRHPWVTSTVAAVRDSDDVPLYLFVQVQDITERRAAEHRLHQSEEMFRLLVEGVADYAIFLLDPGGHIASWNRGAERIKGWTADEVLGKHFELFYDDEARARNHPANELAIARRDGSYEEEGWRVRKDGSRFLANVVITAIYDVNGKLFGFAKVTRDVTERLQLMLDRERVAEQLAEAAKGRTEFLAMTAHELRGPVALLHGYAELLRDHWRELSDGERDDMASTLVRNSSRLQRLVEDLLMASRLESRAIEVRLSPVHLDEVLRAVVQDRAPSTGPEDIEIECPDDLVAVADPGRLQQILVNLLSNAQRYGTRPIRLSAAQRGLTVEVAVSDAGPVIEEPLRSRLFDKFTHGEDEESTGLGLYIVRQLAIAQGGDARYETAADGGGRFVVELPAEH